MSTHGVTLRVNRKLVDWALQQNDSQCAIACAIKDADDDFLHPRVTQSTISFTDARARQRYTFPTPPAIAKWIDAFDRDRTTAKPINIELDWSQAKIVPIKRPSVQAQIKESTRVQAVKQRPVKATPVPRTHRPLRGDYAH